MDIPSGSFVRPEDRIREAAKKCDRLLSDCAKPLDWPRMNEWFAPLAYPDDATIKKVRDNGEKYGIKA